MGELNTYQQLEEAVGVIRERCKIQPRIGFILGSGLGKVADDLTERTLLPYSEIPGFHGTSVEGHAGRMVLGYFEGVPSVFLQGRFHLYEGYPMHDVVFPTRTVCAMGIQTLVLTNAAGGINTRFRPCDLMVIEDHINLMGDNPLKGPNLNDLGPRFPDMTEAYSRTCIRVLEDSAEELDLKLQRGVYAGVLGPTYETPAEIRMLRSMGADAVGMSTVPESIAANHLGVQVCGISAITNFGAGMASSKLVHEEVVQNGRVIVEKLTALLRKSAPRLVRAS